MATRGLLPRAAKTRAAEKTYREVPMDELIGYEEPEAEKLSADEILDEDGSIDESIEVPRSKKTQKVAVKKQAAQKEPIETKNTSDFRNTKDMLEQSVSESPAVKVPAAREIKEKSKAKSVADKTAQKKGSAFQKKTINHINIEDFPEPKPGNNGFPFMKLPVEVRIMVYAYICNYSSIETVTAKLAALPPKPYFDNFEDYDDAWSNRTYALTKYNARKRTKEPRFNLNTPSILLVNKEIYAEAIHELRRAPLVIDRNMSKMFDRHSLTLAHFVPLPSLQKIEHLLFTMKNCAKDFKSIMYDGAKITKDMNKGKVRQKAYWKGVLFGAGEKVLDDPAIRKITFEKLCDEPLILDVKDDEYGGEVRGYLEGVLCSAIEDYDSDALENFVYCNADPCPSRGAGNREDTAAGQAKLTDMWTTD